MAPLMRCLVTHRGLVTHRAVRNRSARQGVARDMTTTPSPTSVPSSIDAITLADPDGNAVPFASLQADPLIVVLVRYFGCLPCQSFVKDVSEAAHRLPAGAKVIAVGGSADYQAKWLRDEQGVGIPLLLDPDQQVRDLVAMGNLGFRNFLKGKGAKNYLDAMRGGLRPQKITKDTVRSPGVAVLGPDFTPRWTHEGTFLGDYPTVDELLARASA